MASWPDDLRHFVEALRITGDGDIRLAARPISRARRRQDANASRELVGRLAACVYDHCYTRRHVAIASAVAPADLLTALEQANTTRPSVEYDWVVQEHSPNGAVLASRHGRTRSFASGQFLIANGMLPAPPGAPLIVQRAAGSRTQQPGFYYCFSDGFLDANDLSPKVRLYWNVDVAGACALIRLVTGALNRYQIPFHCKITTAPEDFARTDNAVLYLTKDHFQVAALALAPLLQPLARHLGSAVPLFTKRLADGVGFAEDPGGGESFGTSRSKLVAQAVLAARHGELVPYDAFASHFEQVIATAGLAAHALHLNPASEDIYEFPRPAVAA